MLTKTVKNCFCQVCFTMQATCFTGLQIHGADPVPKCRASYKQSPSPMKMKTEI